MTEFVADAVGLVPYFLTQRRHCLLCLVFPAVESGQVAPGRPYRQTMRSMVPAKNINCCNNVVKWLGLELNIVTRLEKQFCPKFATVHLMVE